MSVSACSSDGDSGAQKKAVVRTAVQNSVFKPTDLENTVEKLVAEINKTEATDLQLNVILKNLTGYWEPVLVGANRAVGELDVTGGVAAPQVGEGTAAIEKQIEMMNTDREGGSAGFGIAPFETPVQAAVDLAADAGIPVVTIDSDLPDSKRDLYIGTLNADAGKTAGNSLKDLLPSGAGTVVILGHDDPGWKDGYDRSMGAKAVLEVAGYTVVVRKTDWADGVGPEANMAFMVAEIATADPPVVGMLGMFSNAWQCAKAAEDAGKTSSDIAIAAFDFDPKTVDYMRSGMIRVTHAQRQYYMGYLTPYVLYGMNVLGRAKTKAILSPNMVDDYRFNSGLDVVEANQLEEYYSFLDGLGIGGS